MHSQHIDEDEEIPPLVCRRSCLKWQEWKAYPGHEDHTTLPENSDFGSVALLRFILSGEMEIWALGLKDYGTEHAWDCPPDAEAFRARQCSAYNDVQYRGVTMNGFHDIMILLLRVHSSVMHEDKIWWWSWHLRYWMELVATRTPWTCVSVASVRQWAAIGNWEAMPRRTTVESVPAMASPAGSYGDNRSHTFLLRKLLNQKHFKEAKENTALTAPESLS
ncbi:uncharacterized protein LOC129049999 [Pongo abelii]|uniref:uncharacterized protein LOC129049999 n=1 Tax=Pongo abelii TaxID=9601 RepID=UPI0023E81803|nr:uncharacterized protein LOC129049999 [Pongo abelii]